MSDKVASPTIQGKYLGNLRMELTHQQSGLSIITDAPTDNNGKGEAFSPTDLVAGSLVSCILTVIAIRANENNFSIGTPDFSVNKIMQANPRKIGKIEIEINFYVPLTDLQKRLIDRAVKTCPVALSLNSSVEQEVTINYK
jgi:uncharacterized OsmC-like protein